MADHVTSTVEPARAIAFKAGALAFVPPFGSVSKERSSYRHDMNPTSYGWGGHVIDWAKLMGHWIGVHQRLAGLCFVGPFNSFDFS
jgi:hypothetical protein